MRKQPGFVSVALFACWGLCCGKSPAAMRGGTNELQQPGTSNQRLDILAALQALPGVTAQEVNPRAPGARSFNLTVVQKVDHFDEQATQTFTQHLRLLHRQDSAPTVLTTTGYHQGSGGENELSRLLSGNVIDVEQRYFGNSTPQPTDWSLLTVKQAAADHHHVVELLKAIYSGPWISTGASKGGMASLYHRRFYPDDVVATVAYVAPHSYSTNDPRYAAFLEEVGTPDCRDRIVSFQREALSRRGELVPILQNAAQREGLTFERVGGIERAFEYAVQEFRFALWQYSSSTACLSLPVAGDAAQKLATTLDRVASPGELLSDQALTDFAAFNHQVAHELGYYGPLEQHLSDLLLFPDGYYTTNFTPASTSFSESTMLSVQRWLSSQGERFIFIYGKNDPWTAGAVSLGGAKDSAWFVAENSNHGAKMASLSMQERAQINDMLSRWTSQPVSSPIRGAADSAYPDDGIDSPNSIKALRHERYKLLR